MDLEIGRDALRRACVGSARVDDDTLVEVMVTDTAWEEAGQQGTVPCDHPAVQLAAWSAATEEPFTGRVVDGTRLASASHLAAALRES